MVTGVWKSKLICYRSKAYKHPDSALATESRPQFASKYGDPTHPSVMTNYAGRVSAAMKGESLAERQARKRAQALQPGRARGAIRRILPSVSDFPEGLDSKLPEGTS